MCKGKQFFLIFQIKFFSIFLRKTRNLHLLIKKTLVNLHYDFKGIVMQQDIVNHIGTVTQITDQSVFASFNAGEACGSCQAKAICESGKGRLITVEAERGDNEYVVGQKVNVSLDTRTASTSVMIAYVYPLIMLFVIMFCVMAATGNGDAGCLAALGSLPIYYTILYLCRRRIKKKIKFAITEI